MLLRPTGRNRQTSAFLACAALLLAAAGCGKDAGSAVTAAPCDTPGFGPDNITIGLIVSDTGVYQSMFAHARSGVQARIEAANEAGGVNGRKIVVEWRDDGSKPEGNLVVARDLVENTGVFTVVEASSVVTGGADYLAEQGVPVTGTVLEAVWARHPNMLSIGTGVLARSAVDTWGNVVANNGGTRAALLYTSAAELSSLVIERVDRSLTAAGVAVAGKLEFVPRIVSAEAIAQRIAALDVDTVVGLVGAAPFSQVIGAVRQLTDRPMLFVSSGGYDQSKLDEYGPAIAGVISMVTRVPFEMANDGHREYLEAAARYAPELQPAEQEGAVVTYLAADLFIRVLSEAGECPTRASFLEAANRITAYDGGGFISPPVDLSVPLRDRPQCYWPVQVNPQGTGFEVLSEEAICVGQ